MGQAILLVEDNPDDRSLIARELHREFPELDPTPILDAEAFRTALQQGGFCLGITDYQLRWTTGLRVLQEIKQNHPAVPVIMFTGTGNEEIAVDAMKSGLDDYVVKRPNTFQRLPITVRLALERAEAQRTIAETEKAFRTALQELKRTEGIAKERAEQLERLADAVTGREVRMAQLEREVQRLRAEVAKYEERGER